ncbi:peptidoglycan/LPS O-acetylase OafA/YrhL [Amycolatopsis cihanbeyliensis]|uniref:Peptidoglycan/LPS O-acetylase OafA/YrhL n=1 Tax=Amycolatopsis cihanbeyliensis TaxID=1128664 RepID=A0A542CT64_AMYCI|nr:peptidoglycan/LPS O-acetylase OafA/YrhL [Amycolatopsis cihanbeyliensis]
MNNVEVAESTTHPSVKASAHPRARKYRPELQGLRALAAVLVVVYHVWFDRISGGVDVFFVITGFLITGQLVRASERGRIEFRPMWGRMIKRLFPAALTVLVAIMAFSFAFLPESRWFQTIREVVASALYVENWRLAVDSVDYFAQHDTASVVQHFWSLSIQGQFYLVWPLLIALIALATRAAGRSVRTGVLVMLVTTFATSLAYSVLLTWQNQPLAYFHSLTRVWEFALGGLLALAIDAIVLPRLLRVLLGWIGVFGLASCGMLLQVGTVFPGYAALWPTMAAVLVIVAGATDSRLGADRILAARPLEYVGNLSYALYLWHWPVLLFYLVIRDREEVGWRGGAAIIGLSFVLAALTYHLVEKPVRDSRIGVRSRWGSYRFGAATLVPVLIAAGAWQAVATQRVGESTIEVGDPDHPGAAAMAPGFTYTGAEEVEPAPSLVALPEDWAGIPGPCPRPSSNEELEVCANGVDAAGAEKRVVIVGDSHIQQYLAAFLPMAERRNWQLSAILKGACPFSVDADAMPGDAGCIQWNADVADYLAETRPDAVVTLATRDVRAGPTEYTPPGYVEQWRAMERAGIPVVAIRDNARHDFSGPACVERHGPESVECSTPRGALFAERPPYAAIPDVPSNVSFLDFTDYYCTELACPSLIGNVLVYLDGHHLSATYMSTMSPIIEQQFVSVLGW